MCDERKVRAKVKQALENYSLHEKGLKRARTSDPIRIKRIKKKVCALDHSINRISRANKMVRAHAGASSSAGKAMKQMQVHQSREDPSSEPGDEIMDGTQDRSSRPEIYRGWADEQVDNDADEDDKGQEAQSEPIFEGQGTDNTDHMVDDKNINAAQEPKFHLLSLPREIRDEVCPVDYCYFVLWPSIRR